MSILRVTRNVTDLPTLHDFIKVHFTPTVFFAIVPPGLEARHRGHSVPA